MSSLTGLVNHNHDDDYIGSIGKQDSISDLKNTLKENADKIDALNKTIESLEGKLNK